MRCKTTVACYAALKGLPGSSETRLDKGCIVKQLMSDFHCRGDTPIVCCSKNLCNMNITPTLIPTLPESK